MTIGGGGSTLSRPITVMHLLPALRIGGMERGVVKLACAHDRARVRVRVCSFMHPDPVVAAEVPADVPLDDLGRRDGNDPAMVRRLAALLRRVRPDVVHTHSWGTLVEGYLAARVARVPALVHGEHGTMALALRQRLVQRWLWPRFDRLLAVSSRLADRMAERIGVPRDSVTVIRNGLDLRLYGLGRRGEARRLLGLRDGAFVVGTVGRLVPVKVQALLLEAVGMTRAAGLDVQGVLVGEGPLLDDLRRRASALGVGEHILFAGARQDVPLLLEAFDVFALCSDSEGLSNTIQEAMASGLPVVATDVGGNSELVTDGKTGILVPPRDPTALARTIEGLARSDDRRRQLGGVARETAARLFSLEAMVDGYETTYAGLSPLGAALGQTA